MGKPRGRHPHQRLTALAVKRAGAGRHADGNGLYLDVDPSGARRWILRTVVRVGSELVDGIERVTSLRREIGLGSAALVGLGPAREEAERLRGIARAGGDPLAVRRTARRHIPTFAEATRTVHASHTARFRNDQHRGVWLASLERHVFPVLGALRVDAIESAHVLKALESVWTKKPETARRVRQRVKVVLDWAKVKGFRAGDNPADTVASALPKMRTPPRHLAALPYLGVPAFVQALRAADAAPAVKLAFEFLILTAARTTEALGAEWTEIDRTAQTWTVPAERIKAGREHRVPLSARALEILDEVARLQPVGRFVFPGRKDEQRLSNMALLMLLRRLGYEITTHGFRSSFRDWAAERTTFVRHVCEAALAHVVENKVEAAYLRTDLFESRRALMATWATFVTSTPADVVTLRA